MALLTLTQYLTIVYILTRMYYIHGGMYSIHDAFTCVRCAVYTHIRAATTATTTQSVTSPSLSLGKGVRFHEWLVRELMVGTSILCLVSDVRVLPVLPTSAS